jgi:ATP-binding cassette subfamily F protein 3
MNEGMDEEQVPKKKPELLEGPSLSERNRRKKDREKRQEERQREVKI